jgi:purine catabolism regulator
MADIPSVTLSEIMLLALPPGSRALTGEAELGRRVHWARLLRARPASLGSVEAGEVLLLSAALFEPPGEPRVQARLIGDLIEAGVGAFISSGEPPEPVLAVCQQQSTPLLQVPPGVTLAEIERSIIGLILDRDAQLRRRAEEIYEQLLATMLGDAGLPALVAALAEATGLRAAVFDDYLALRACAPEDEAFQHALAGAAASTLLPESSMGLGPLSRPVALRFEQEETTWRGQLYPLQIESSWAGYLGLFGPSGQAGDLHRLLADRATTLVALELAKQRAVAQATQRWRGEFLDDLLSGSFPTEEAVLARGRQLGYDLSRPQTVFMLGVDPANGTADPDALATTARQRRRFPEVARSVVQRLEPRALAVEREGTVVALLPANSTADDLVERARMEIEEALPEIAVSAGIGRPVTQPREIARAQREATQAYEIGQRLLGGKRTVEYGQLGIERLLVHLLGNPELESFARDVLGGLLAYDAQHGGELVRTLEVFLRCNGNHVRAAQELVLHRNTLLYRLGRVREILGCDLEQAETRLALQVALRTRGAITNSSDRR